MSQSDPPDSLGSERRLRALQRTGLLDTAPEEEFDRLTRLACRLLGVPMALCARSTPHRALGRRPTLGCCKISRPW
ncbi:MAG: hypothetical protein JOY66_00990 [Acetobacteraceae bacterium]|nr:hypothetical protein [Acetobacteraceae bacterium]